MLLYNWTKSPTRSASFGRQSAAFLDRAILGPAAFLEQAALALGDRGPSGWSGASGFSGASSYSGASGFSGLGGSDTYTNAAPTPVTLGGIPAGSTFAADTMTQMWDALLYPYQAPAFTSFSFSGQSSPVEVGYTIPAAVTFDWGTSNPSNVQANSISITDTTLSITLASGLANTGSYSLTMPNPIERTSAGTHSFGISGTNTHSNAFSRSLAFSWEWRSYWGNSSNATLTAGQIQGLTSSGLASAIAGTYATAATGFKFICVSDAIGGQINTIKDLSTGFAVQMATVADDPSFSNVDGGGYSYSLVSVTSLLDPSIVQNFRCYRTHNSLGSALTMVVT